MKQLILVVTLVCWVLGASAQETMKIQKVKKGQEPEAVMNAIKNDFPAAIAGDLSFLPSKLYGEEWNINVEGDQLTDIKFYEVTMKEGNQDYVAVYDANGKLLSSKELIHNAKLPKEITATLKKFEGWHIDKTHEIIKYNGKQLTETYKVKLQKGAEHKTVFLDTKGAIINTRFTLL